MPTIKTSRLGELTYDDQYVITFPDGLIAFPQLTRWIVCSHAPSIYRWLQSIEDGDVAFLIADPQLFDPDYRMVLDRETLRTFNTAEGGREMAIAILVSDGPTLHLHEPILIASDSRIGRQLINDARNRS